MKTENDTPRTDTLLHPGLDLADAHDIVDLCRQLERELTKMTHRFVTIATMLKIQYDEGKLETRAEQQFCEQAQEWISKEIERERAA